MKKLLLFARDPGGANVIVPIYENAKLKFETVVYARDVAFQRFVNAGISVKNIGEECSEQTYAGIIEFLRQKSPDLVITGTSLDDFTERYLWKASEELHIKSFAVLDQWMNLGIRFSDCDYSQEQAYHKNPSHPYLPYRILAMDELAKELLVKEGIEEDRIVLTGQPHFDTVRSRFEHARRIYGWDKWNIVFASEPICQDYDQCDETKLYWGYNERTIFASLYRSLERITAIRQDGVRLIIRPHPREDREYWDKVAGKFQNSNIILEVDRENDSFSLMKSADLICGMSSMFLLESIICGKQVLSIAIGLKGENPFVLDRMGQCKSILSEEELVDKLKQIFLRKEDLAAINTRGGVCDFGYPEGVSNATDKIMQLMEEEVRDERIGN